MKRSWIGIVIILLSVSIVVAYGVRRAGAFGVPSTSTLSYTGTLMTFGAPDNSSHSFTVALTSSGTTLCTQTTTLTPANGQFTVPLPASCAGALHQNPNAQVQLTVDGTSLGTTAIGAVPYALEAGGAPGTEVLYNIGLATSVGSNALLINLVQDDGVSAPTSTNPVIIGFRSGTSASGALTPIQITSSLSIAIPASATLGQASGVPEHTNVYAQDVAGTVQLCVSTAGYFDQGSIQISLAISTSSTSRSTLYCTAAASGPVRLLGRLLATESTAGNWATAPTEVVTRPFSSESVTSASPSAERIEHAYISAVSCAVSSTSGNWISSTSHPGTGICTLNFAPGEFGAPPVCVATQNDTPGSCFDAIMGPISTSSAEVATVDLCVSGGPGYDRGFYLICMGPR